MAAYHFVAVTENGLAEELRRVSGGHRDEAGANLQPVFFYLHELRIYDGFHHAISIRVYNVL